MATLKRLVFGFHQAAFTSSTVRQTVETAGILGVELHGVFLQDPLLRGAAAYPGLREFRLAERQWRTLNTDSLTSALDRAARRARSMVETESQRRQVQSRFEIVSSEVGSAVEAALEPSDIIVIPQAGSPLDTESRAYRDLLDAVCRSSATVLVLPKHAGHTDGPVLAISRGPEDRSIPVAEQIAERLHAPLLVEPGVDSPNFTGARGRSARERMVIMSRPEGTSYTSDRLLELMVGRSAPVLLLSANGKD